MEDNLLRLRVTPELMEALTRQATRRGLTVEDVALTALADGLTILKQQALAEVKAAKRRADLQALVDRYTIRQIGAMQGRSFQAVQAECARLGVVTRRPGQRVKAAQVLTS